MANTEQLWEQESAFPDMQIFIGPDEIRTTSGTATLTLNASGDLSLNIGNSQTTVNLVSEAGMYRTGRYATAALDQNQFGTAGNVPGPSAVANTNSPLGEVAGFPPIPGASLPTVIGGIQRGPISKGVRIDSVDFIYLIAGLALTTNQVGITKTTFVNNVAVAVSNVIAKAANGMQTATQANPYVTNVPVTTPTFLTAGDSELLIEWDVTTGASGTARLYGVVLRCSFNFN